MDSTITHDTLFQDDLRNQFGPNFLPLLKMFSLVIALVFIIIILLTNLSVSIQPKVEENLYVGPKLDQSIVKVN